LRGKTRLAFALPRSRPHRCSASRFGLAAASCRRRFSAINELEIGTATNTSTHSPVTVTSPTNNVRAIDCRQLMTKSPEDCPVKQHHDRGWRSTSFITLGSAKSRPAMNRAGRWGVLRWRPVRWGRHSINAGAVDWFLPRPDLVRRCRCPTDPHKASRHLSRQFFLVDVEPAQRASTASALCKSRPAGWSQRAGALTVHLVTVGVN
jgi:hypothetical protein